MVTLGETSLSHQERALLERFAGDLRSQSELARRFLAAIEELSAG